MTFRERIKEGIEGKYSGLNNGLKRINQYLFGVQRGCYYLLGGLSGAAKTTFVDFMLINAIEDAESKGIPINVFYYSLEIDEITKKANWLSVLIYNKYNIIITPEKIKGLGDFRLTKDEQEIVNSEIEYLEHLWSKIHWIFDRAYPTGLYKSMWDFMSKRGTFEYEPYIDELGNEKQRIVRFINNNPDEYNIVVADHIAKFSTEKGCTLKDNLDKLSDHAVSLRNLFHITFIYLQQFNQGLNAVDRQKFKAADISPTQGDFRDSTVPYTDCDVAIGLMNAHMMGMDSCLGYNINNNTGYNLKHCFRMLKIIKNRLSRDNIAIGLLFQANCSYFEELPKPQDINKEYIDRINKIINN